jgi:hypothetical protein
MHIYLLTRHQLVEDAILKHNDDMSAEEQTALIGSIDVSSLHTSLLTQPGSAAEHATESQETVHTCPHGDGGCSVRGVVDAHGKDGRVRSNNFLIITSRDCTHAWQFASMVSHPPGSLQRCGRGVRRTA